MTKEKYGTWNNKKSQIQEPWTRFHRYSTHILPGYSLTLGWSDHTIHHKSYI